MDKSCGVIRRLNSEADSGSGQLLDSRADSEARGWTLRGVGIHRRLPVITMRSNRIMKKRNGLAMAALAGVVSLMMVTIENARSAPNEADLTNRDVERKIRKLLDDDKAVFVS